MIRSQTGEPRILAGTSWTRYPRTFGRARWEPPTAAAPEVASKRIRSGRRVVGEPTALQTMKSAGDVHSRSCAVTTLTLSRPRRRTARRARSVRREDLSKRVTWVLGQAIARGSPGSPTPAPTSSREEGGSVELFQAEANRRESAKCRVWTTRPSEGPRPPPGMASFTSQSARPARRASWGWSRGMPAHWAARLNTGQSLWGLKAYGVSRETS